MSKGIEDWNATHDHGVPPTPWSTHHGAVYDSLGRRIAVASVTSTTRGYVGANDEMLDAIVRTMNGGADEKSMSVLQREVVSWANTTFPNRQPHQGFMKLYEELGEVVRDPRNEYEWADVFIMLLDLTDRHGISGQRLSGAIDEKMDINRRRQWKENEMGVMQHVGEEGQQFIDVPVTFIDGPWAGDTLWRTNAAEGLPPEISATVGDVVHVYSFRAGESDGVRNAYAMDRVVE